MTSFLIENKLIGGESGEVFIIAEIGQNHQGNLEIAREMILRAKECGCDCVKFQKSCLQAKFTSAALNRPYCSPNSWGKTYGDHKRFLEFNIEQYKELKNYANKIGILFSASAMDEISLQELLKLNLPFIKIGSGDANNFQLLEDAAKILVPLIISTGMQTMKTIQKIVKIMEKYKKKNFSLLHCVSSYPTKPEDANLGLIKILKENFPNVVIGYSGHEEGILISKIAALQGARIIERHFTLDKLQKGTDHKLSLIPDEFKELINFIKKFQCNGRVLDVNSCISIISPKSIEEEAIIRMALKDIKTKEILDCEKPCKEKLGKSIVYSKTLQKGHVIQKTDLTVKVSEPFGIPAENLKQFKGAELKRTVSADAILTENDFLIN